MTKEQAMMLVFDWTQEELEGISFDTQLKAEMTGQAYALVLECSFFVTETNGRFWTHLKR